jgi:enamine deaminase RidA (YjgF/YER057c/UK114 family)
MNTPVRPASVAPPTAAYELATLTPAGSRLLHTAGIVATAPDGSIPETVGEQAAAVWRALDVILAEAGFDKTDIVSYTTYVVHGENLASVMTARDAYLDGHRAASTLVTVPALVRPEWKVEITLVAARLG